MASTLDERMVGTLEDRLASTREIDRLLTGGGPLPRAREAQEGPVSEGEAARAAQAFDVRMTLATGLAMAGGVALASGDGTPSPLFALALACLAGCAALQITARRRVRSILVRQKAGERAR
ncbi:MAG: hypothetical protein QM820_07840 [Minicystis sp.]